MNSQQKLMQPTKVDKHLYFGQVLFHILLIFNLYGNKSQTYSSTGTW